ncbi:MAG: LacI family DNA-binding transcriptional regulator [Verrucomicrobia bacterium]|nr:LacI family DNA-binding transcriptional regulator [Verrucomicrobiota bacterium]
MADPKNKLPTSFDVARLAEVSRSAVSRAYTEGASIADDTRQKVFDAAERLGYRVNALARSLQGRHSNIVGLVASRIDTPLRACQIKFLAQSLLKYGFRPMLLTSENQSDVETMLNALLSYNVAGMIITSDTPPPAIIEDCCRLAIPVVLINRDANMHWGDRVQMSPDEGGATCV